MNGRALAMCLLMSTSSQADEGRAVLEGPLDALRQGFLRCEQDAGNGLLGGGDAARCSAVFEALKRRAFAGDFGRLLAWWRVAAAEASLPGGAGVVEVP